MGQSTRLAKKQQRALDRLSKVEALRGFYLAGGTALGLRLGHRRSLDLDLFSVGELVSIDELRRRLVRECPDAEVVSMTDAALTVRLEDTEVDIISYRYPPLEPLESGPGGFPLASLVDLAVMKLAAIARRGIRRDFWDLHEVLRSADGPTLRQVAEAYRRRFGLEESDLYHVARALTFFGDAEKDPAFPRGLTAQKWGRIKRFFRAKAPALLEAP
jgi:hypothetical protein